MSNGFAVPFSSSPPSTPDSRLGRKGGMANSSTTFASHPSTTPMGPPPSSAGSFTPAGAPPSAVFGSSQPRGSDSLFGDVQGRKSKVRQDGKKINSAGLKSRAPKHRQPIAQRRFLKATPNDEQDSDEEQDEEEDEEEEGPDPHILGRNSEPNGDNVHMSDQDMDLGFGEDTGRKSKNLMNKYDWTAHGLSTHSNPSQRGFRNTSSIHSTSSHQLVPLPEAPRPRLRDSVVSTIAKDIAKTLGWASLTEPDTVILETEEQLQKIYFKDSLVEDSEQAQSSALQVIPEALIQTWQNCCDQHYNKGQSEREHDLRIGPSDDEPSFRKATFVSTLLFNIQHPPVAKGKRAFYAPRPSRSLLGSSSISAAAQREEVYPKVLLDWLEEHHNPYKSALVGLMSYRPNSTAHWNFWDVVFAAIIRGKLADVVQILKDADFSYARCAKDDGQAQPGYSGSSLEMTNKVVDRAIKVLESCPGVRDDNWETTGDQWVSFRRRAEQALTDLSSVAEGRDRDQESTATSFEAANFGLKSTSLDLSMSARRAESKVPWTIYQSLKLFYGLLLGGTTELLSAAQDWVEATIALTVWWDGDDDEITPGSIALSRRGTKRSRPNSMRLVDVNVRAAYQRRLSVAFDMVTSDPQEEDSFQIDSTNSVEVAVASIFEGNMHSVLDLLRSWSMPIAAAAVEIGTNAGWYESLPADGMGNGFDESDLMVLNYGQDEQALTKDVVLSRYAEMVFERDSFKSRDKSEKEGWELSIEILSRLDDRSIGTEKIRKLLRQISVNSDERADKLISLCRMFGLDEEACAIAEKYGDSVAESSVDYGTALIYYARSHKPKKVKDVLDLLISYCLVKSVAYPAVADLDSHLGNMLTKPRDSLLWISELDPEAARILSIHMSGYATLRKYYDSRDEAASAGGQSSSLSSRGLRARMKAAAVPLLTVIASAADNIQGGLYDVSSTAVVPIDGLLVLLGEATVFVDQKARFLSLPQLLVLLRAIEDLQTVHPHIRSQCEECFNSTLSAALGTARPAAPQDLLKKSVSSLTSAGSGFSLVGSSMLQSEKSSKGGEAEAEAGSEQSRGWDWRVAFGKRKVGGHGGNSAGGNELLDMLRLGLAREVARAWIEGEEL